MLAMCSNMTVCTLPTRGLQYDVTKVIKSVPKQTACSDNLRQRRRVKHYTFVHLKDTRMRDNVLWGCSMGDRNVRTLGLSQTWSSAPQCEVQSRHQDSDGLWGTESSQPGDACWGLYPARLWRITWWAYQASETWAPHSPQDSGRRPFEGWRGMLSRHECAPQRVPGLLSPLIPALEEADVAAADRAEIMVKRINAYCKCKKCPPNEWAFDSLIHLSEHAAHECRSSLQVQSLLVAGSVTEQLGCPDVGFLTNTYAIWLSCQ